MANIPDGGPAFPSVRNGILEPEEETGMSLRDYFAAKAMPQVIANYSGIAHGNSHCDEMSAACYAMADAMLRARSAPREIGYEQANGRAQRPQSPADIQRAHLETFGKP